MEIGPLLALIGAMSVAMSQVLVRKGVYGSGEAATAAVITVLASVVPFAVILPLTGGWEPFSQISWRGFAYLAGAGIVHFVVGRSLIFDSIRLIGANKAASLGQTHGMFSVVIGLTLLSEAVTPAIVLGAMGITGGAALINFRKEAGLSTSHVKGVLFGLVSGLCAAVSAMLIRMGIAEAGSPYAAAFISYLAAGLVMASFLLRPGLRLQVSQLSRYSFIVILLAGTFSLTGYLLRYAALSHSPISIVQPLMSTGVLFVLLFSFVLNRRIDFFNWKVIIGLVFVVAGTFLMFT